jgi:hypothetical protein
MVGDLGANWTNIILNALSVVGLVAVGLLTWLNRKSLKTANGLPVGAQTEQANALSALTLAYLTRLLEQHGVEPPPPRTAVQEAQKIAAPLIHGELGMQVEGR